MLKWSLVTFFGTELDFWNSPLNLFIAWFIKSNWSGCSFAFRRTLSNDSVIMEIKMFRVKQIITIFYKENIRGANVLFTLNIGSASNFPSIIAKALSIAWINDAYPSTSVA